MWMPAGNLFVSLNFRLIAPSHACLVGQADVVVDARQLDLHQPILAGPPDHGACREGPGERGEGAA